MHSNATKRNYGRAMNTHQTITIFTHNLMIRNRLFLVKQQRRSVYRRSKAMECHSEWLSNRLYPTFI